MMSLIVLSHNVFLEKAFNALYDEDGTQCNTCIVDLDSFFTLNQMENAIRNNYEVSLRRIILIGRGAGIISRLMLPFQVNFIGMPVNDLKIVLSGGNCPGTILEHISEARSLNRLSEPELWLSSELRTNSNLTEIADNNHVAKKNYMH
ncbi:hypothetical protein [Citrobacter portucalensis]|uniref:hypothetical protein n=1 Tax=Citrobacter portucalensis TaxID=1639133 RepID=UPI00226B673C|nr:hypothetical protein [Citrobacter portucalensis]MCX8986009.1 hypothetical protein [Citrobacter portucalensis]